MNLFLMEIVAAYFKMASSLKAYV